ncbi:hypothetical protein AB0J63_04350 [Streptosporangium canum]
MADQGPPPRFAGSPMRCAVGHYGWGPVGCAVGRYGRGPVR